MDFVIIYSGGVWIWRRWCYVWEFCCWNISCWWLRCFWKFIISVISVFKFIWNWMIYFIGKGRRIKVRFMNFYWRFRRERVDVSWFDFWNDYCGVFCVCCICCRIYCEYVVFVWYGVDVIDGVVFFKCFYTFEIIVYISIRRVCIFYFDFDDLIFIVFMWFYGLVYEIFFFCCCFGLNGSV